MRIIPYTLTMTVVGLTTLYAPHALAQASTAPAHDGRITAAQASQMAKDSQHLPTVEARRQRGTHFSNDWKNLSSEQPDDRRPHTLPQGTPKPVTDPSHKTASTPR